MIEMPERRDFAQMIERHFMKPTRSCERAFQLVFVQYFKYGGGQ